MLLYLEDMKAREVEQFSQDHTARMKSTQDNHQCLLACECSVPLEVKVLGP